MMALSTGVRLTPVAESSGPGAGLTRDCLDPWTYLEISASGDVRPCCNFSALGTLDGAGTDASALRNSDAFRGLRQSLLSGNLEAPCRACHIRSTVPREALAARLDAARRAAGTADLLAPLRVTELRIDINEKCNLRCDYCAVSSPGYAGVEMDRGTFERALPLIEREAGAIVHVNGHGETTFHPRWVEWCTRILDAGHRPFIITNLAKAYTDEEVEVLSRFHAIQVSLDSDDGDLMRRVRKAVNVDHVFQTIDRIRQASARRGERDVPHFSASVGVYDPSVWTLERFVVRLVGMRFENITFWDLVEREHQSLVRGLHQLDGPRRAQAREILRSVQRKLEVAGVAYTFAGDFHGMVPVLPRGVVMVLGVLRLGRRCWQSPKLRRYLLLPTGPA